MITEQLKVLTSQVEGAIAEYYNIPIEEIRSNNTKSAATKARHFSIYFLHTKYKLTCGQLGEIYKRSRHWLFDICRQMRNYAQVDARYRKEMSDLESILSCLCEE